MPAHAPFKPQVERVVVVHNHTRETRDLAHAAEIDIKEGPGLPVKVMQTLPGGLDPNLELFSNCIRPGDIVGGVHGDGTAK